MRLLAKVSVGLIWLVAALHLYFLVLEMFLWTKPIGLKTFGNALENVVSGVGLPVASGMTIGAGRLQGEASKQPAERNA